MKRLMVIVIVIVMAAVMAVASESVWHVSARDRRHESSPNLLFCVEQI
jgi:cobalamin biosynthesis protein CobD/CbiB